MCNHGDLPVIEDGEQLSITSQTNYSTGDLAVYSCDGSEAANYGYVVVKCTVAGWDEPDRNCDGNYYNLTRTVTVTIMIQQEL